MIRLFAHSADGQFIAARFGLAQDCEDALLEDEEDAGRALTLDDWSRRYLNDDDLKSRPANWIDLEAPTADELAWLGRRFHLHPLALEDCTHFNQRSKVEEYANHLFVAVHGVSVGEGCSLDIYEVHLFLTRNCVITVREGPVEPLKQLQLRIERDRVQLPMQSDFVLHRILDTIMDVFPVELEKFEQELDHLDAEVSRHISPAHLERIHDLRNGLTQIRKFVAPQRDIYTLFTKGSFPDISKEAAVYFRDIYDHCTHVLDKVDELRERIKSVNDAYIAASALRTNETMKRLTVFSAIFLPLTFVTGFFGMNFEHIPWASGRFFWTCMLALAVMPVALWIWFRRNRWLE